MKKKLESELMSIAQRILKLEGKEDVIKMHAEVAQLFEKLTVLKFAHENLETELPKIGGDSSFFGMLDTAFNNKISDNIEVENKTYVNVDEVEDDDIMEPVMEKIKDLVSQMPHETQQVDTLIETIQANPSANLEDITAGFEELPLFEPLEQPADKKKKSLNDQLKTGIIKVGLNDKIAFINQLFEGKVEDYERVLSQLNTTQSFNEAVGFIENIVKPDYNWHGKEAVLERFMTLVENKFD